MLSNFYIMKTLCCIFFIAILSTVTDNAYSNGDGKKSIKYRITAIQKISSEIISESNVAEVHSPLSLYVPSAFTPNNDGLNDSFGVVGEGIKEYRMSIFSRWGETIYYVELKMHDSDKTDDKWWDGTFNGEPVQDGVYAYHLELKTWDNKTVNKSGSVTVIR